MTAMIVALVSFPKCAKKKIYVTPEAMFFFKGMPFIFLYCTFSDDWDPTLKSFNGNLMQKAWGDWHLTCAATLIQKEGGTGSSS